VLGTVEQSVFHGPDSAFHGPNSGIKEAMTQKAR
jgi:hypothetical protein